MTLAADTSVVVAAFASWHEHHEQAMQAMAETVLLPAHAAVEVFSVLTRLPQPFRVAPEPVVTFLQERFADTWISLPATDVAAFLAQCGNAGIAGGRTYDALIGVTAARYEATILTLDRRALATYESVGCRSLLIA